MKERSHLFFQLKLIISEGKKGSEDACLTDRPVTAEESAGFKNNFSFQKFLFFLTEP